MSSSSRSYLHLKATAFSEMEVDDNAMDVTTFHLALLYFLLIRDFSTPQHSIRLLLFPYLLTRASGINTSSSRHEHHSFDENQKISLFKFRLLQWRIPKSFLLI